MRYVYINDNFVSEDDAKVSIYDAAITVGDMVTEVARTFDHHFFELEYHIDRFLDGVEQLKYPLRMSKKSILNKTVELFNKNKGTENDNVEWQTVYIVSKGLDTHFKLFPNVKGQCLFAILCFPLKYRLGAMKKKYDQGSIILVAAQKAIPHNLLPPQIKSRGRFHFKMAKMQVMEKYENADALLLDENNYITEVSGANLFLIRDNKLFTAPEDCVVAGITRKFIINIAKELGIEVYEKKINISEIGLYNEAFITSTIIGLVHVRSIEDKLFGKGECGPITELIRNSFINKINCDFVKQATIYAQDPEVKEIVKGS